MPEAETKRQHIAALSASLGALAMGACLGWASPVGLKFKNDEASYSFTASEEEMAWVGSIVLFGAAVSCYPIGLVMEAIGRRRSMMYLAIPFTAGWGVVIFAQNVIILILGRFITGVAGGAFCVTAPTYCNEVAIDSIRGAVGSYFQLMITVGILFSYIIGSYTGVFLFNIICASLPIVFFVILWFMPESPKYLVLKNKHDEAREALIWLRGKNYNPESELETIKQQATESQSGKVSLKNALRKKTAIKALIICYALMACQQLSGINAVIFNTSIIFASSGAAISPEMSTIIVGFIQVLATFTSSEIVDKLGRKILLLFSVFVMTLSSVALGFFFFLKEEGDNVDDIAWLPLVALSSYVVTFSLGIGPIPWMMAGELCLMEIKAFVTSTGCTLNWLIAFTVACTFTGLQSGLGAGEVYWLFAMITTIGFFFILFFVPETKGKSLAEVQQILQGKMNLNP